MAKACHLDEEIPKLGRKGSRDYKPRSNVEMVDTNGKPKDPWQQEQKRPQNRVEQCLCKAYIEYVPSLGNKWEEPENPMLLHNCNVVG